MPGKIARVKCGKAAGSAGLIVAGLLLGLTAGIAEAAALPPIRTTAANRVPECVTPERLMAFLAARNRTLDARYKPIAELYRQHGEAWRVRWDYAFFQMALETRFLSYTGDVKAHQNNFAGLGATGGGVRGDSYPDISTGVLAQIQHLVVYSGERVPDPIGLRTRLKQNDIIFVSQKLKRDPTFADLANRWAADRNYGRSIAWIAEQFHNAYCTTKAGLPPSAPKGERREEVIKAPAPILVRLRPKIARHPAPDKPAAEMTALAGDGSTEAPPVEASAPKPPESRPKAPERIVHTIIVYTISGPSCIGDRVVYSGAPGDAARWKRFFDAHPSLGIHYIVDRAGTVLSSTSEDRTANHALGHIEGTIGIELVHNGDGVEPFGDKQIDALINLIKEIRTRHTVPIQNIKSHDEVDTRTFLCGGKRIKSRSDPGANFPWPRLRAALEGPSTQ